MSDIVVGAGVEIRREGKEVLAASNFTIPEAKITAIIGPNGSGKSTVLHAIAGLLGLHAGSLSVLGNTPAHSRAHVAYVLQHMNVNHGIPMTVKDVVSMGRYPLRGFVGKFGPADRQAVSSAMELLRIDDLAERQVFRLSGGQR
jgi:manganese transport system ATP-binding protein